MKFNLKVSISFLCLVMFLFAFIRLAVKGESSIEYVELQFYDQILSVIGVFSAFGFWFLMLSDFFTNNDIKRKTLWGLFLIFFSWLGATIYFVKYFLPRNKVNRSTVE